MERHVVGFGGGTKVRSDIVDRNRNSPIEPVHLLQIWIQPDRKGVKPAYAERSFGQDAVHGLKLVASREEREGSVDIHQDADVYASLLFSGLSKNVGGTWTNVAPAGTFTQFSASDHEQVWFLDNNGSLDKYDANGVLHNVDNVQFLSLSAAADNDVFVVFHDDSLWERKAGIWQELSGPGTVAQ